MRMLEARSGRLNARKWELIVTRTLTDNQKHFTLQMILVKIE